MHVKGKFAMKRLFHYLHLYVADRDSSPCNSSGVHIRQTVSHSGASVREAALSDERPEGDYMQVLEKSGLLTKARKLAKRRTESWCDS